MISRLGDLSRMLRFRDIADIVAYALRRFFRIIEALALPVLLLGTLALVSVAISRSLTWGSMADLVTNPKDRIGAETQIFITLGQILGGGFILTGLYFTGKSYVLARRGQFAERLGSAIEGLGSEDLQRRVGSIISLGAMIGDESGNVSVVTSVLCSFIRVATAPDEYRAAYNDKPRADVQAAISVLGQARRRVVWWDWIEVDLRASFLPQANFNKGDFRHALFQDCLLTGASFFRCRLANSNFSRATLGKNNFNQADLRQVAFFQSTSGASTFRRSNLVNSNLSRMDLTGCSFDGARIIHCTFAQSELKDCTFRGTRIRGGEYHKVDPEILERMGIKP